MTNVSDADSLCMQCGLCCDGTFFGSVVVAEDEPERLGRIGLRIVRDDGSAVMRQPCIALKDCLCTVYADRPSACARYECLLRKSVQGGGALEQALGKVTRMRELMAILRNAFEAPVGTSIWERILALEEPATAEEASAAALKYEPALAAVGELLALGRAEFEPKFSGGGRNQPST